MPQIPDSTTLPSSSEEFLTQADLADFATDAELAAATVGFTDTQEVALDAAIAAAMPYFNVRDYGALGDGATDDTVAIQAAIDAAIAAGGGSGLHNGTVVFPPGQYKVTDTLEISATHEAVTGNEVCINLIGSMSWIGIAWEGANSIPVFHSRGWKRSRIEGINIVVPTADSVVGWEIDDETPDSSSSYLDFRACHVTYQTGAASGIGWRMGVGLGSDESFHTWTNCSVNAATVNGHTGWNWNHANCLAYTWTGCFTSYLDKGWSGLATVGASQGGGGMVWNGCGSSHNTLDFRFAMGGSYTINGGRFEEGDALLDADFGDTAAATVCVTGVEIGAYDTTTHIFNTKGSVALNVVGLLAYHDSATYSSQMFQCYGTGGYASLTLENCRLCVSASGFYYFPTGTPQLSMRNNVRLNAGSRAGDALLGPPTPTVASATTTTLPPEDYIIVSGTTTITSVTASYPGRRVVLNFSGALTFTDGSNLKLAGNLVTTADDTISLVCDGTNWIETGRSVN